MFADLVNLDAIVSRNVPKRLFLPPAAGTTVFRVTALPPLTVVFFALDLDNCLCRSVHIDTHRSSLVFADVLTTISCGGSRFSGRAKRVYVERSP
jgi:hypothetical protein